MARLPNVGSDADQWGGVLNEFLLVAHNNDGSLRAGNRFPAIVTPKEFGPIDGKDDHIQVQQALDSGYPVLLDQSLVFGGRVNVPTGATITSAGYGRITIGQTNLDESHFYLENSKNTVLEGLHLQGRTNVAAIHVKSLGGDRCENIYLGNILIDELGATGIGIHLEQQAGGNTIYFTTISNCTVCGGNAQDWQEKIGIRLSGGTSVIVGTRIFGGRFWRLQRGHSLENCDTTKVYGAAFDDCSGGNGRGVYFDSAGQCEYIGCRFEPTTFDKVLEFTGRSADNVVGEVPQNSLESDIIDQGVRNGWYGSDGSGGLFNKLPCRTPVDTWKAQTLDVTKNAQISKATIDDLSLGRGSLTTPELIAPMRCDLGGMESGTGPGGSAVAIKYNFLYQVGAVYLATMMGVSMSDVQHYAQYLSIFAETSPGQFVETNLVDKRNVISNSGIRLSRDGEYIEMEVTTTGGIPGETVSVKRNLIRLS